MVNNLKCDMCKFNTKCVALNKLKPFLEGARTDYGVTLEFIECVDYSEYVEDEDEAE